jgi:CheY-like chemotaxis protein
MSGYAGGALADLESPYAFLQKPFSPLELRQALAGALARVTERIG